ncbi:MAG TPA: AraC family transcriptional regulator ligand-binding domain-containing protein [Caulobacteraceae bacterium]|jgi:AraC-like DNA-binding protein
MLERTDLRPAPATYFQQIVRRFGDSVATRAAILEDTGVGEGDVDDVPAEITLAQQLRQFDNMNRLFGEGWALSAPELWRPAAHGALGVAVSSAPDVGSALHILARYIGAHTPNQHLKLVRAPGSVLLRHDIAMELDERHARIMAEGVLLGVASLLSLMLGRAQLDLRFDYAWSEPTYGAKLTEAVGAEVRWNAPASGVAVPRRLLTLRSPLSNAALCHHALELLEQSVFISAGPEGVKARVQQLLARSDDGRVAAIMAARSLGLSQRTLARRLAEAGVTYRELADAELKARASRWLTAGVLSKAEIGERLGFADATGFSRACRRWFRT